MAVEAPTAIEKLTFDAFDPPQLGFICQATDRAIRLNRGVAKRVVT